MKGLLSATLAIAVSLVHGGSAPLELIQAGRSGDQFHFTLSGSHNEVYVIQSSLNLTNWTPVVTNRASGDLRSITVTSTADHCFYRAARVQPRFSGALVANRAIAIGGATVSVDSFDSTDPSASTDAQYDPSKATDRGELAAHLGVTNTQSGGRLLVKGFLRTGPQGEASLGPTDSVGTTAWVVSGQLGIQPGHLFSDMNLAFPDAPAPLAGGLTPNAGNVGGTNYTYVLSAGHYRIASNLWMTGLQNMMVTAPSTLFINGEWSMSGQSQVILAPAARLTMFVRRNASLSGHGFANQRRIAERLAIYGLAECTDISLSGGSEFAGLIYAPHARLSLSGNSVYIGAMICSEAVLNGTFDFHFDEALKHLAF